jgi:hypothetical protein
MRLHVHKYILLRGGRVEYLHREPESRRRRRKGKSQIWDSKILCNVGAALLGSAQQLYRLRHLNATRIVDPFITIPDHT